uniref:Endonuclease/exonuclease/phosphatase domain-containing protein n=1 Tax=Cajanus cajan TaxID=3821 RepID=A0A151RRB0_CAJCA|nr:hypothetical protein KK1_033372 [Cajanus cajan]
MGDFNDLLSNADKRGPVDHPSWLFRGFREVVVEANLVDIPLCGYPFTWTRRKGHSDQVEERLDRAMATQIWFDIFPQCTLSNAIASRFENSWLEEPDISHIVEQS